jgi:Zn finger protein HypA/HybF involved in hydrogenase expression
VWEPRARLGYTYSGAALDFDEKRLAEDLHALADEGYLERIFIERLMICPSCESHAVNVHEACVTCSSSNLATIVSYFHFRCGYVGPEKTFKKEQRGLRCPKCKGLLVDLGTDHDSPGEFYECRGCEAMFQQPQMAVRCLSCGGLYIGTALQSLRYRDVYAYRLLLKGEMALMKGSLGKPEAEPVEQTS